MVSLTVKAPVLLLLLIIGTGFSPKMLTECDISGVLKAEDLPFNSFARTALGDYEEATEVLLPSKIEDGNYSETITRKGQDIYKLDGYNLYLNTSFCYEYSYGQKVSIRITNYQGHTFGKVTFK